MSDRFFIILNSYWDRLLILLPKLVVGVVILVAAFFISLWMKRFIRKRLIVRLEDPLLAQFIGKIVRWVVFIIGFIVFMQVVGLSGLAGGLLAGASVSAFIIGFAFKDIGENFLAGIILAFDRPFKIGDIIVSDKITGTVQQLNLRTTSIKTFEGHDVYIPNGDILKNPLTNYNKTSTRRHEIVVGIDYGNDPAKALELIYKTFKEFSEIIPEPEPMAIVDSFGASSVNIKVFFWLDDDKLKRPWIYVKSDIIRKIKEVFDSEQINIPFDILQLRMHNPSSPLTLKLENELEKTKS